MELLLGCIAVILTIALIFGRRVARIVVLVAVGVVSLVFLCVLGVNWYQYVEWSSREAKVQATMKRMPPGIPEEDRKKIEGYLRNGTGLPEGDRKMIDDYLKTH
jgi:energy-coupling factor transporter transmembrane protein EcfT